MTKRKAKIFVVALLSLCLLMMGGCYSFTPLKGGPADAGDKPLQGGIVQVGDYIYSINGIYDSAESNEYGTPVKGAIYRTPVKADGTIEKDTAELLCAKQVYSATKDSGLYIYKDRIYFASPSLERNKAGELLTNYLDLFSVKLDGSDLKKLCYITGNAYASRYFVENGKAYLAYIYTPESTDTKSKAAVRVVDLASGEYKSVVEEYTQTPIFSNDGYIYYERQIEKVDEDATEETPDDEKTYESYYNVYRQKLVGGTEENVLLSDNPIIDKKYALTLTNAEDGTIYFTKTIGGTGATVAPLYAYRVDDKKLAMVSVNALATVYKYYGFNETGDEYLGVIASYSASATAKLCYVSEKNGGIEHAGVALEFTSEVIMDTVPSYVMSFEGDMLYYASASTIERVVIKTADDKYDSHGEPEKIYEKAVNTTTFIPQMIGDYVYFVATDNGYSNFVYRMPKTPAEKDPDAADKVVLVEQLVGKYDKDTQKTYDKAQKKLDNKKK